MDPPTAPPQQLSRATTNGDKTTPPKHRLKCSYGGRILPRTKDNSLSYVGGNTHIIAISRTTTTLTDLITRISKTMLNDSKSFTLKYQLPTEGLDNLITVSTQEDLDNLIDECDCLKNGRIRLFLFPGKPPCVGPTLGVDVSEEWFLNVINGGSDPNFGNCVNVDDAKVDEKTTSSFGSASSSLMNLPPIRVHVGGIEEQFGQMSVGGEQVEKRVDESLEIEQNHQLLGEFINPEIVSSDSLSNAIARQNQVKYQDRTCQFSSGSNSLTPGVPTQQVTESGYAIHSQYEQYQPQLLPQQPSLQAQTQNQQAQAQPPTQQQYIPAGAHFVHHHPPGTIPMPAYYPIYPPQQPPQYPVYYVPVGQPQVYPLPGQYHPNTVETLASIPPIRMQNQTQTQTQAQTPLNPTTIIPTSPAYNQIRNMNMVEMGPQNSEMGPTYGVCRTTSQMIQVPSSQHLPTSQPQPQPQPQQQQFVGYSQIRNPSQSIAPNSPSYAHELNDPAHSQIYYTQPGSALGTQFQAVTSGPAMMMSDGSSQLSNDNVQQQIRSSQPL